MNAYEQKQEAKRERYAERAKKKRAEAEAADKSQRAIADHIPLGQPILVGHHSEMRHRRDLARIDRGMRKAIDANKEADRLEQKAESYGTRFISSDDPDAVAKLQHKLARLEGKRTAIKEHNRLMRKNGNGSMPKFVLTNLGANIRTVQKRIDALEKAADREANDPIIGDGWRIEEHPDDNRIRFYFDEKPDRETCRKMKLLGFRWSPNAGAWQRNLNNAGIYAAHSAAHALFGWTAEAV